MDIKVLKDKNIRPFIIIFLSIIPFDLKCGMLAVVIIWLFITLSYFLISTYW